MVEPLPLPARRAVIVDDERLARRELRSLLEAHPAVSVVGEAETLRAAAEVVRAAEADVVFLDIQLQGESGLDLLPLLDPAVAVVFVTAYDHYAVRAFELNALDYLLKPVAPARLAAALRRLAPAAEPRPESAAALDYGDYLFLRVGDRMRFLKVSAVVAVLAEGDYTTVRLAGGESALVRKAIREWEGRLPARHFVRIHRSALVNLEFVERVEDWFNATYQVYLRGLPRPLPMSRRCAAELRDRLG